MNTIRQDILKTLAYFDYFNYPLTCEDVRSFLAQRCAQPIINEMLTELVRENIIYKTCNFYSLQKNPHLAKRRLEGNQMAVKQLSIAKKVARILSHFPYVQSIAVSGSLSKHFADEKTDIDFFIVTSANRLWIARTIMHLLKKFSYIVSKQHWFCMNYYVDEHGLEIPEKNIFTAMEIVTLMPMQGITHFKNFIAANTWVNNYFPAHPVLALDTPEIKRGLLRKCVEKVFSARLGDIADQWLMKISNSRWEKKARQGKVNDHGIRMGMIMKRHFSKPDPKNFQVKLLEKYSSRVNALLKVSALQAQP